MFLCVMFKQAIWHLPPPPNTKPGPTIASRIAGPTGGKVVGTIRICGNGVFVRHALVLPLSLCCWQRKVQLTALCGVIAWHCVPETRRNRRHVQSAPQVLPMAWENNPNVGLQVCFPRLGLGQCYQISMSNCTILSCRDCVFVASSSARPVHHVPVCV